MSEKTSRIAAASTTNMDDGGNSKPGEDAGRKASRPEYDRRRDARIRQLRKHFEKVAGEDGRITLEEFKHSIKSKNDFFTDRLFKMFDKKKDGRISLDEFSTFLMNIKTPDDKIDLLFDMYDLNDDNQLDHEEVRHVISEMVVESRLKLSKSEIESLSNSFFENGVKASVEAGGGEGTSMISKEGFRKLLKQSGPLTKDVSTLIDHWIGAVGDAKRFSETEEEKQEEKALDVATQAQANPTFYAFFFGYVLAILLLMIMAAILHRKAKDKDGNPNLFLITARIFGFPLNFVSMMVYVFVLRNLLDALRGLGAVRWLPMDHNLFFHMLSGWILFIYGGIHTIVHFVNFKVNVVNDPGNYLAQNGLTADLAGFHPPEHGGAYTYVDWMFTPKPHIFGLIPGWANITGVILMALMAVMLITSQEWVRRGGYFNLFYFCHLGYIPYAVLLILHAPNFSYFFPIVGVFVALELLDKMLFGRKKSYVTTGILLPSDTVCLVVKKSERLAYKTGDWISLNIPSIAYYEWHAFTISSSPEFPNVLTLHIKVVGSWTRALQKLLEKDYKRLKVNLSDGAPLARMEIKTLPHQYSRLAKIIPYNPPRKQLEEVVTQVPGAENTEMDARISKPIMCYIAGPYAAPANSFFMAEHAVLIATGIGVTPMTSILHTVLYRHLAVTHECPNCDNRWTDDKYQGLQRLKKVDFIWIVKDPTEVSWFLDLLAGIDMEQETTGAQLPKMIESHIYVTRALAKTDMCAVALRIALNLFYQKENRDIVYGLKSQMIAGRPNLDLIFSNLNRNRKGEVSVFYCGNAVVGDILEEKCTKYKFAFHREIF